MSKQFPVLAVPLLESLPKNCLVIPSAQIWIRPNRSVDREQQVYKKCFFSLSCPRRIERYKSEHDRRSERGRLKKGARTFNSERDRRARTSTLNRTGRREQGVVATCFRADGPVALRMVILLVLAGKKSLFFEHRCLRPFMTHLDGLKTWLMHGQRVGPHPMMEPLAAMRTTLLNYWNGGWLNGGMFVCVCSFCV